jgi:tricorn protease
MWDFHRLILSMSKQVLICGAVLAGLLSGLAPIAPANAAETADARALMRFPDIHENTIVFVYGEDIWTVPAEGGVATRLTLQDGEERFPKFSPDGKWIAFTGDYDGNSDVYVMSVYGGDIRRVTFHPGYDEVVGWHPTRNKILFRSRRASFSRFDRLFLIDPDGTGVEMLPIHEAAQGSFSPDGRKIAYNRVSREFRTWKRYQGGNEQNIYIYDFDTKEDRLMTDFAGTDRTPMWGGGEIYFSSDRNRTLNLFALDPAGGAVSQLTKHTEYDVRRPSIGPAPPGASGEMEYQVVYEHGGELYVYDTYTREARRVPVEIKADAPEARPYLKDVSRDVTGIDISPSGKRALIVARGDVFTVPAEKGPTRNLTASSGARDKAAAWSPDGRLIAYLSDASGEYEIWIVDPMKSKTAVKLTAHKDGYRHTLRWSPDSKKIAFADQTLRCYILDVGSKKVTEVDRAEYEHVDVSVNLKPIYDFAWSPDSRYLAYSKLTPQLVYQVYVYEVGSGQVHCVSDGLFNDFGPAWSRDGKRLFFVSNRHFDPTLCDFEWEMVYKKAAGIYCLTLAKDAGALLPPESDEEPAGEKGEENDDRKKEEKKQDVTVEIDWDGLAGRIERLPLEHGNYRWLEAGDGALFYLDKDQGDFNRFEFRNVGPMDLYRFEFKDREQKKVIEGVDQYRLSADGKSIVYRHGDKVGIIEASAKESKGEPLDLSGLKMHFDPRAEWAQIFNEAWRMERDFYYEPNMHGIDWPAMRERYGRLVRGASCRQDIRFIVGELIGELNTSHTYVFGGDRRREAERVNVGMLGVDWEADANSGRYRIEKIYRVPDWTREVIPPLDRPGVDVREGDFLLAVNGVEVSTERNIYSYFQDLAGEQVRLLFSTNAPNKGSSRGLPEPDGKSVRECVVEPLRGESTLRYLDWVEHNRAVCEAESDGEIGYIHLPDTYMGSAREFPKYYYSQLRKKGLVIDGRFNGGGLDPYIFLHRLRTVPVAYWTRRYSHDQTIPDYAINNAHMVCLTNRQAGSGGDMLPMEFQMLRMGPVIGTRTWGGLVGVSMFYPMVDGGGLTCPDYRIYTPEGKWIVENEGVTPDIVVDLSPAEVFAGFDAQLMRGIEELKKAIAADPRPWPEHPPYPVDR